MQASRQGKHSYFHVLFVLSLSPSVCVCVCVCLSVCVCLCVLGGNIRTLGDFSSFPKKNKTTHFLHKPSFSRKLLRTTQLHHPETHFQGWGQRQTDAQQLGLPSISGRLVPFLFVFAFNIISLMKQQIWKENMRWEKLTVANFSISSSETPREASPISCENCANSGSASIGTCPSNSCTQSLQIRWSMF